MYVMSTGYARVHQLSESTNNFDWSEGPIHWQLSPDQVVVVPYPVQTTRPWSDEDDIAGAVGNLRTLEEKPWSGSDMQMCKRGEYIGDGGERSMHQSIEKPAGQLLYHATYT